MRSRRPKTVFVLAMLDSVHVANWLAVATSLPERFVLISTSPHRNIHPTIIRIQRDLGSDRLLIPFLSKWASIPMWIMDQSFVFSNWTRAIYTLTLIRRYEPSHIVLMETQQAGYVYRRLTQLAKSSVDKTTLLVLFGSDLYWFSRLPKHQRRLVNLLENVDFLATEGKRDRFIAASLGYDKSFFRDKPVSRCPSSVSKYLINNNLPSGRKKIAVKGYSNKFGKGEIALDALERLLKTDMKRYEIAVFSAEGRALKKANQMKKAGFQIVIHKKFSLSQGQVIQLLSESRLYVGLSRSDGLPASFIEALAVGTFPVQTDTSLAGDWIQDGKTGYIVSLDDPQNIELCLLRALENDNLVDEAAEKNIKLVSSKADRKAHEQLLRNELASFLNS